MAVILVVSFLVLIRPLGIRHKCFDSLLVIFLFVLFFSFRSVSVVDTLITSCFSFVLDFQLVPFVFRLFVWLNRCFYGCDGSQEV